MSQYPDHTDSAFWQGVSGLKMSVGANHAAAASEAHNSAPGGITVNDVDRPGQGLRGSIQFGPSAAEAAVAPMLAELRHLTDARDKLAEGHPSRANLQRRIDTINEHIPLQAELGFRQEQSNRAKEDARVEGTNDLPEYLARGLRIY